MNKIGNIICSNVIGDYNTDEVIVVTNALLLEDSRPLMTEDGHHLQLENNTDKK